MAPEGEIWFSVDSGKVVEKRGVGEGNGLERRESGALWGAPPARPVWNLGLTSPGSGRARVRERARDRRHRTSASDRGCPGRNPGRSRPLRGRRGRTRAGWRSGGEVGSPIWARVCVMGPGSVRKAMKVRAVPQETVQELGREAGGFVEGEAEGRGFGALAPILCDHPRDHRWRGGLRAGKRRRCRG